MRAQPTKTSVSHFRDREKPSVLTANNQNSRFFASRTPHDSPTLFSTGNTPVINLAMEGFFGRVKNTDNGNRAIDEGYRRKCA